MIDKKTGSITLSATRRLSAGDAFDEVSGLPLGEVQTVADLGNGWKWLTIKNVAVEGKYFILSLGFHTNVLKLIELMVANDRFDLTPNWADWSEANELAILTDLRIWVANELGREGAFEWGDIEATYDSKSGSSSITIRYH
ncbi:hypothetical protein [Spirosoma flavum]|uniref:Uncharacterized protein n=1 Tax=Spirosoma flavum TaxID=2048557 RepID=A0ABW6AL47_9BACT